MKADEAVTTLLKIWEDIRDTYETNRETVHLRDQETQDLLHEIEFGNLSAAQQKKIYGQLKEARKERRRLKNENEALEPLYNILSHKSFEMLKIDLHKAQGIISRILETQAARSYKPRVRSDLTICGGKQIDLDDNIDTHNKISERRLDHERDKTQSNI